MSYDHGGRKDTGYFAGLTEDEGGWAKGGQTTCIRYHLWRYPELASKDIKIKRISETSYASETGGFILFHRYLF